MQSQPQQSVATLPLLVSEPQFATVTFVGEDEVAGTTFRVPLNGATTVSRLAKDAMRRLVLSRSTEERHRQFSAIAVTEVYVGGGETQPKAEVFAQDIVTQVVLVKEERIYMKLRSGPSSAMPSRLPTPPPPPPPPQRQEEEEEATQQTTSTHATATATTAVAMAERPSSVVVRVAKEKAHNDEGTKRLVAPTAAPPLTGRAAAAPQSGDEDDEVLSKPQPAAAHPKRPGWGPEAYDHFADNYVSTPGKRPRKSTRKGTAALATPADSGETKKTKTEFSAKPNSKNSGSSTTTTTTSDEKEKAALQTREAERGLRWGPEASKNFPENYVSSPEKLARLARQQRRLARKETAQTAAGVAPSSPLPPQQPAQKALVSRELVYPADQLDTGRTTVGHPVEREVVTVEEDSAPLPTAAAAAVELPKGWGVESLRFFDPNTYCDDPTKARLMPNMDLSRSVRQRRPALP